MHRPIDCDVISSFEFLPMRRGDVDQHDDDLKLVIPLRVGGS